MCFVFSECVPKSHIIYLIIELEVKLNSIAFQGIQSTKRITVSSICLAPNIHNTYRCTALMAHEFDLFIETIAEKSTHSVGNRCHNQ